MPKTRTGYQEVVVVVDMDKKLYDSKEKIQKLEKEIYNNVRQNELSLNATYISEGQIFAFSHVLIDKDNKAKAYIWKQQYMPAPKSNIVIPS